MFNTSGSEIRCGGVAFPPDPKQSIRSVGIPNRLAFSSSPSPALETDFYLPIDGRLERFISEFGRISSENDAVAFRLAGRIDSGKATWDRVCRIEGSQVPIVNRIFLNRRWALVGIEVPRTPLFDNACHCLGDRPESRLDCIKLLVVSLVIDVAKVLDSRGTASGLAHEIINCAVADRDEMNRLLDHFIELGLYECAREYALQGRSMSLEDIPSVLESNFPSIVRLQGTTDDWTSLLAKAVNELGVAPDSSQIDMCHWRERSEGRAIAAEDRGHLAARPVPEHKPGRDAMAPRSNTAGSIDGWAPDRNFAGDGFRRKVCDHLSKYIKVSVGAKHVSALTSDGRHDLWCFRGAYSGFSNRIDGYIRPWKEVVACGSYSILTGFNGHALRVEIGERGDGSNILDIPSDFVHGVERLDMVGVNLVGVRPNGTLLQVDDRRLCPVKLPASLLDERYLCMSTTTEWFIGVNAEGAAIVWRLQDGVPVAPRRLGLDTTFERSWKSVAIMDQGFVALSDIGEVFSWGQDNVDHGIELRKGNRGLLVQQLAAGVGHCLALDLNGSIYSWGNNDQRQWVKPRLPARLKYTQVAASGPLSAALASDGSIIIWGGTESCQVDGYISDDVPF